MRHPFHADVPAGPAAIAAPAAGKRFLTDWFHCLLIVGATQGWPISPEDWSQPEKVIVSA